MEKIKQESLEMFMLKRKILKELEQMDENEDFIMQIGLAGKEKNERYSICIRPGWHTSGEGKNTYI